MKSVILTFSKNQERKKMANKDDKDEKVSEFKSLCVLAKQAWMKEQWTEMEQTIKEVAQKQASYREKLLVGDGESVSLEEIRKLEQKVKELYEMRMKMEQHSKSPDHALFTKDEFKDAVYEFDDQEKIHVHAHSVLPKKVTDHYFNVDWVRSLFQHSDNVYDVFNGQKLNVPEWFAVKYPPLKTRDYPLIVQDERVDLFE